MKATGGSQGLTLDVKSLIRLYALEKVLPHQSGLQDNDKVTLPERRMTTKITNAQKNIYIFALTMLIF